MIAFALLIVPLVLASNASASSASAASDGSQHSGVPVSPGLANAFVSHDKMDADVARRATDADMAATADVIVTLEDGFDLADGFQQYSHNGRLSIIHAYVLDQVPTSLLGVLASDPGTRRLHINRLARKHDALSSAAVNANAVDVGNGIDNGSLYTYTGAGVTVAFIDSGITEYQHPDVGDDRVLAFVDFVNDQSNRYDDNGHGTHVAGIIGGTGELSARKYAGVAPGASLVSLKVLNDKGEGTVGNILKALDWIYENGARYGIRVVNMSVGAQITESYYTDPLTLAAKVLVDSGITVVAAAGNNGKNPSGVAQWGGITSPGNAPWVLTVCAFSTNGTYDVADDAVADFSSAGPTALDYSAKPDVCAPGVGIVSTAGPGSRLFQAGLAATPSWVISATVDNGYAELPYESLTGTSMATPFVSGAIALMLEANPTLTPNLIKAILEFTANSKADVSPLRQGAGFMNVSHAVALAALAAQATDTAQTVPIPPIWARHVLWGNHMISGGVIDPRANAWALGVEWGWALTAGADGDNIVWGTVADGDNIVWGTAADGDNIVWGTNADGDNIVWGTSADGDNIVWGTSADGDNIVWGTDCGGADCDNIVWGTVDGDNIVWGTAADGDNIVWGTGGVDGDNIVWGTIDGDNIVWGTMDGDNIVWGTADFMNTVWPIFAEVR